MSTKKKGKPALNTPFKTIINQMTEIDGKIIPCLIDFEGLSIYHCDTPLYKNKVKSMSLLTDTFLKWQQFVNEKAGQNLLDLSVIHQYDTYKTSVFYHHWLDKYKMLRDCQQTLYFKKWILHYKNKLKRDALLESIGRSVFSEWRIIAFRSRKAKKLALSRKKSFFDTWRKNYKLNVVFRRVQKLRNLPVKKRFFRLWKRRIKPHQLKVRVQNYIEVSNTFHMSINFVCWKEKYLTKTRKISRETQIQRVGFHLWRKSLAIKQDYQKRYDIVSDNYQKHLEKRAMKRWKRKHQIIKNKRFKASLKLWTLIVAHRISFSQIKQQKNLRIEAKVFALMIKKVKRHDQERKRIFLQRWRRVTFISKAEALISENSLKIKCETYLMRWRMMLRNKIDEQIIAEMKKEIVDRNNMRHAFYTWLDRSLEIRDERRRKVKQFRRKILLVFPFMAWKNFGQLQTIRAKEHYKQTMQRKYFPAFIMYKEYACERKLELAALYSNYRLKKRFFRKVRKIFQERHIQTNDQMMMKLLNQPNTFFGVSRLSYI
ncbi:hypothetical protein TRFO_34127 [Tritrichomonas foetus]|uniref:Sfi1 spindle body domain-containing protein n=1 Tax=Tritrichomonas foetus TaxID=1144522 RepID=A0A1J4JLW1_9EUKA|nr:hypothetical protein TRFO_34127 [Tritrichomonas foetus]|eukprot:OHS99407.1 hypothetical protein TRFO_34127 [Tritrichomonas foetus]